jgi:plasmid stabilization system protein ParE
MKLIIRPEAEAELVEAIDWYEVRSPGLGCDFLRCVDACLERILRNPDGFPLVHRSTRMAVVRRFPYLVLYRTMENAISVIAVFHAKRNPRIWKDR